MSDTGRQDAQRKPVGIATSHQIGSEGGALAMRHRRVAVILAGVGLGMLGMAYAAVPLYRIFCQVTGYGGTPQIATKASETIIDRTVSVRFDANVAPGLQWRFKPRQNTVTLKLGETYLAHYQATNLSDRTLRGTASFNVAPDSAGAFFNKIECFCFTEQVLKPGETADMPVTFFVDPAFADDPDAGKLSDITLSYTFYPMDKKPATGAAALPSGGREGGKS